MNKILVALVALLMLSACKEDRAPVAAPTDADIAGMVNWTAATEDTTVAVSVGTCRRCGAQAVLIIQHKASPNWSAFCWKCGNRHSYSGCMDNTTINDIVDPNTAGLHSVTEVKKAISRYMTATNAVAVKRYAEQHRKHTPVEVFN